MRTSLAPHRSIPVVRPAPFAALLIAATLIFIPQKSVAQPQSQPPVFLDSGEVSQGATQTQLQTLVAPIALYPDPLLAQILQASTYPDQVSQAAMEIQRNPSQPIDSEIWDASVIAVGHYPPVIEMMARQINWTTQLGQAYLSQQGMVLQAVQALRLQAKNAGNLKTTPQQQVVVQGDNIQIYPAVPSMLYVPTYDPTVVYSQPAVWGAPLIGFGAGWAIGSAMSTTTVDWVGGTVVNYPPGAGWRGAYTNGGYSAVAGQTWNGTSYAARSDSTTLANGGDVHGYQGAAVGPDGAASGRGWSYDNGSQQAGGFSRTVATDNGVYNIHGAGASGANGSDGYVTATEVNRDGQVNSQTATDRDGDISSDDVRADSAFSEARNNDWDSSYADRGAWSRGGDFSGARFGGFRGGGFRR